MAKDMKEGTKIPAGEPIPPHRSVHTVRDSTTNEPELIIGGWTESAKRRAKLLGKKPGELTKNDFALSQKELQAIAKKRRKEE